MNNVLYLDATGVANFESVVKHFEKQGGTVLVTEIQGQPLGVLQKAHLDKFIGPEHFFEKSGDAITYSLTKLNKSHCLGCQQFAFRECQMRSNPSLKETGDLKVLEPSLIK